MSSSEHHNSEAVADDNQWPTIPCGWDIDPAGYGIEWTSEAGKVYSQDKCIAALRGEKIPVAAADLHTLSHVVKLCILRGIRHHYGFGTELRHAGLDPASFRRALNAQDIMNNVVPDIDVVNDASSIPYCIWYPDVASETTYRELAMRYPQMRYQVGRACAVAGYSDLYKELDLLPDISTAEEAQDSVMRGQRGDRDEGHRGSAEIFQHIVQQRCAGR